MNECTKDQEVENTEESFFAKLTKRLINIFKIIFREHNGDNIAWDAIAEATFYNRENELNALIKAIKDKRGTKNNIIVIGDAGVGKTTLIKKAINKITQSESSLKTYYLNLKSLHYNYSETQANILICSVLNQILEYNKCKLTPNEDFSTDDTYREIVKAVTELVLRHELIVVRFCNSVVATFFLRAIVYGYP